jgi:uncharacterized phage-associated protein
MLLKITPNSFLRLLKPKLVKICYYSAKKLNREVDMDYLASVQAIDYIINNISKNAKANKLSILKLLFFAEKYHVRKYGSFFTNDVFYAMKLGPVPSGAKNLLSFSDMDADLRPYYDNKLEKADEYFVKSLRAFKTRGDYEDLSDTAIESLDFAIKHFGRLTHSKLVNETHKYPEWKRFEATLQSGATTRENIVIDDYFIDSIGKNDPYNGITSNEVLKLNQEWFKGEF